jgi:arginine decarboxylase
VLPPSVEQVLDGLKRYPEALAVVYTSPTYEDLCANTHAIAAAVHDASEQTMLFVDEAWGGQLHFHPDLPPSAIDAGAKSPCSRRTSSRAGSSRPGRSTGARLASTPS